jgi:hypothetical protein
MFSRDNKHYRATPRTTQQAFGPYHRFQMPPAPKQHAWDIVACAVGVILLGALYGYLFAS